MTQQNHQIHTHLKRGFSASSLVILCQLFSILSGHQNGVKIITIVSQHLRLFKANTVQIPITKKESLDFGVFCVTSFVHSRRKKG